MILKNKVLIYVLREKNGTREVLVFDHQDHPYVNPQVPGGTIEEDEAIEDAAIREQYEESGIKVDKENLKYHGSFSYHRSDIDQIHNRIVFTIDLDHLPDNWDHLASGSEEEGSLVFKFYWLSIEIARMKLV
jgi:8-oxo-dGTP pyrophosphatase MutT (NUDIX family)